MINPPAGRFANLCGDQVLFGPGSISSLAELLDKHDVWRAVVVSSASLCRGTDLADRIAMILSHRLAGIVEVSHDQMSASGVLALADKVRSLAADGLLSLGGGGPNDAMKMIAIALAENLQEADDFGRLAMRFEPPATLHVPRVTGPLLPTFAIPTTLSAGEFSAFATITDRVAGTKALFNADGLAARAIVLDPELTFSTPEGLWLATGVKAIDHCVESLLAINAQPYTDALASHALAMLHAELKSCRNDPENIAARGRCQVAAWMSFANAANVHMGLSHGLGIILGARYSIPHGETSCVLLHTVMAFNREATCEQQARIAAILGVQRDSPESSARAAANEVLKLVRDDLGLPSRLRDVGVPRSALPGLAREVLEGYLPAINPRPLNDPYALTAALEDAW